MSRFKLQVNEKAKGELYVGFWEEIDGYIFGSCYDRYVIKPELKGYVRKRMLFGVVELESKKEDKVYKTLGQVHQQICKDYPDYEIIYNLNIKSRTHGQSNEGQTIDANSKRLLSR